MVENIPQKNRRLVISEKNGEKVLDLSEFIIAYGRTLEKHLRKTHGINSRAVKSIR
jgi:hypothetical protein